MNAMAFLAAQAVLLFGMQYATVHEAVLPVYNSLQALYASRHSMGIGEILKERKRNQKRKHKV